MSVSSSLNTPSARSSSKSTTERTADEETDDVFARLDRTRRIAANPLRLVRQLVALAMPIDKVGDELEESCRGLDLLESEHRLLGTEEARLIFLAAQHALDLGPERSMVVDIGGGSVQIAVGSDTEVVLCQSLRLGVQRLLARQGHSGPLTTRQQHELAAYVEGAATDVFATARRLGYRRVVGTSGTIRTLGEAAHAAAGGPPWRSINAQVVHRRDLSLYTTSDTILKLATSNFLKIV